MTGPNRSALAHIIARPIRFSWLLLPLMGFECVMSEHPLAPLEEGFVDEAVLSHWYEAGENPDEVVCETCDPIQFEADRAEFFEDLSPIIAGTDAATCTFIIIRYELTSDDRLTFTRHDNTAIKPAIQNEQLDGGVFIADDGDLAGEPGSGAGRAKEARGRCR